MEQEPSGRRLAYDVDEVQGVGGPGRSYVGSTDQVAKLRI